MPLVLWTETRVTTRIERFSHPPRKMTIISTSMPQVPSHPHIRRIYAPSIAMCAMLIVLMLSVMRTAVLDRRAPRRRSYASKASSTSDNTWIHPPPGMRTLYKDLIASAPNELQSDYLFDKSISCADSSNERNGFSSIQEARELFPTQKLRDMAEDHLFRQFYLQPSHAFFINSNPRALTAADDIDNLAQCDPNFEGHRPPGVGILFHHSHPHNGNFNASNLSKPIYAMIAL